MLFQLFFCNLLICLISDGIALSLPNNIRIRQGKPSDELPIIFTMARELMNPLGISHNNNLLIACDTQNSQDLIGWAQIRSFGYLGGSSSNDNRFEDKSQSKAAQSRISIEQEVDDMMWEEFEDDPTPIPTGLASLPWTDEYKAASRAAGDRADRRKELLQTELNETPKLWELSSVYVVPKHRRQGVGSELVRQVLQHQCSGNKPGRDVYALTLSKNVEWYKQFGFVTVEKVPEAMSFEVVAGNAITTLIGEELVCIRTHLQ